MKEWEADNAAKHAGRQAGASAFHATQDAARSRGATPQRQRLASGWPGEDVAVTPEWTTTAPRSVAVTPEPGGALEASFRQFGMPPASVPPRAFDKGQGGTTCSAAQNSTDAAFIAGMCGPMSAAGAGSYQRDARDVSRSPVQQLSRSGASAAMPPVAPALPGFSAPSSARSPELRMRMVARKAQTADDQSSVASTSRDYPHTSAASRPLTPPRSLAPPLARPPVGANACALPGSAGNGACPEALEEKKAGLWGRMRRWVAN